MSIAYQILQRHQATVEVESILDQGTTFELSFPVPKD